MMTWNAEPSLPVKVVAKESGFGSFLGLFLGLSMIGFAIAFFYFMHREQTDLLVAIVSLILLLAGSLISSICWHHMANSREVHITKEGVQIDDFTGRKKKSTSITLDQYLGLEVWKSNSDTEMYLTLKHKSDSFLDIKLAQGHIAESKIYQLRDDFMNLFELPEVIAGENRMVTLPRQALAAVAKHNDFDQNVSPLVYCDNRINISHFLFLVMAAALPIFSFQYLQSWLMSGFFMIFLVIGLWITLWQWISPYCLYLYPDGLELKSGKKVLKKISKDSIKKIALLRSNRQKFLSVDIIHEGGHECFGYTLSKSKKREIAMRLCQAFNLPQDDVRS